MCDHGVKRIADLRSFPLWPGEERPQDILEINAEIYGRHKLSYLRWNLSERGRFLLSTDNNMLGYSKGGAMKCPA